MTIPTQTPAKNPFTLPTVALTQAIEKEWNYQTPQQVRGDKQQMRYDKSKMPLTALL